MKKITFMWLFLLISAMGIAQVGLTTAPAVPTSADNIVLTFDKTGTPLAAEIDIYAHIGITVDGKKWQKVIAAWAVNVPENTFTNTTGNLYELNLGNLYDYFGVPTTSTISEICLVIRNAKGTAKSEANDVFLPIFAPGLNVVLSAPSNSSVFALGGETVISADASINSKLALYINDVLVKEEADAKTISYPYTFSNTGNVAIKVIGIAGDQTKEDQISVYVPMATITETRPANLKHGVNKIANGDVTFLLFAPNKTGVMLIGDFNDWAFSADYQMKKDGDYFWLTIPAANLDANKEYTYQYAIDFSNRLADGYTEKTSDPDQDKWISPSVYPNLKPYPTGKTTGIASTFQINEEQYIWKTTDFKRPDKTNTVFYELHFRDFTTEGSFDAAIKKLDVLKELGVTGVELMPVNEFEGNNSWGYNPSFYFALDKAYGTKNKFKEFVDACHERGMSVILDVVYNHTFSQSPLLRMYEYNSTDGGMTVGNPYYAPKHNFKISGMRFGYKLNHESEHTQRLVKDAMSHWINEYKVDGFRLDLTKGFTNTEYPNPKNPTDDYGSTYNQERIDRLTDYANYVHDTHGKDIVFSIEHLSDNSEETVLVKNGLMPWGNMNSKYTEAAMGYNTASKSDLSWGFYKNRGWANKNLVSYMESHDEERLMYKNLNFGNASLDKTYSTKDMITALKRVELATCFFLTIPGPKMIWQFGELGYDYGINYCQTTDTYGSCRTDPKPVKWEYYEDPSRKSLFNVFASLNKLKKAYPNTFNSNSIAMSVGGATKRINLYDQTDSSINGLHVVVVGNFDVKAANVAPNFPYIGTWYEFFTGNTIDVTEVATGTINLAPGEYRLYMTKSAETLSTPDLADLFYTTNTLSLYPNPANNQITFSTNIVQAQILDVTGKVLGHFKGNTITTNNTISVENLTSGIYLVKATTTNNTETTLRFVKE